MMWLGADPGGDKSFGVAILFGDGSFKTSVVSRADQALGWFRDQMAASGVSGVGIDAPLWWSSGKSSDREADKFLRKKYKISAGTVQTANSLRGAALVQGVMLANRLREEFPDLPITEAHPKALLLALKLREWPAISEHFGLTGNKPKEEHERDALLGAVAARDGALRRWLQDLAQVRDKFEQDPQKVPAGPIHYWWPNV